MRGDCTLKKVRMTNVRCLEDTGEVPLSPVTLLVGENSSGKSTFLRAFPLLRQSMDDDVDGPILWTGKQLPERDVDFGSFRETFTRNKESGNMTFQFEFPLKCMEGSLLGVSELPVTYSITISQMKTMEREYVAEFSVKIGKSELKYQQESADSVSNMSIDGFQITDIPNAKDVFPEDELSFQNSGQWKPGYQVYTTLFRVPVLLTEENGLISSAMKAVMEQNIDKPHDIITDAKLHVMTVYMLIGECRCQGFSFKEILKRIAKSADRRLSLSVQLLRSVADRAQNAPSEKQCYHLTMYQHLYIVGRLAEIDRYIADYLNSIHYFGPLRATAQRFYANRNLGATDVDAIGSNLPYVLLRLARESVTVKGEKKTRLSEFQAWMDAFFGFHVKVVKSGYTVSMLLEQVDKKQNVNLADVGFGYSQLLPMLVQIWDLATKRRTKAEKGKGVPLVIAIEEPELHLHPGLQARLAEILLAGVRLAQANGVQMQLLLETHSETIVNFFGRAIAKGKLTNDEVSIVLFERSQEITETAPAKIHLSGYNKDGYLTNWPIGFLASRG